MYTISLQNASDKFPELVRDTLQTSEEVIIVTDKGSVVMMTESDWESAKEMLKLLKDKRSLDSLLNGHQQRDQGLIPKSKLAEQIFDDL